MIKVGKNQNTVKVMLNRLTNINEEESLIECNMGRIDLTDGIELLSEQEIKDI